MSPQVAQSGVEVTPDFASDGILFTNDFRRRAAAFVYKVATIDSFGTKTSVDPPQEMSFPGPANTLTNSFDLDSATALNGTVGTLTSALNGQYVFFPVTSSAVSLPADSSAAETLYDVVVVGPSAHGIAGSPTAQAVADGNAAEAQKLESEWGAKKNLLTLNVVVLDIFAPAVFNFLPLDSPIRDALGSRNSTLAADLGGIFTSLPDVNAALTKGNIPDAFQAILIGLVDSTEAKQKVLNVLLKSTVHLPFDVAVDINEQLSRFYRAQLVIDKIDSVLAGVDIAKSCTISPTAIRMNCGTSPRYRPKFTSHRPRQRWKISTTSFRSPSSFRTNRI